MKRAFHFSKYFNLYYFIKILIYCITFEKHWEVSELSFFLLLEAICNPRLAIALSQLVDCRGSTLSPLAERPNGLAVQINGFLWRFSRRTSPLQLCLKPKKKLLVYFNTYLLTQSTIWVCFWMKSFNFLRKGNVINIPIIFVCAVG